ncbi:hypothetical protein EC988_003565 [Linderina pennispora]|nr:hypothetical protein EC988_003565 [Linderina pennispora]
MLSSSKYTLSGKVAIITGGLGGIGQAIATKLLEENAKVVLADIHDQEAGQTLTQPLGSSAAFIHCNVTDPRQIAQAISFAATVFGQLDILVNNAGIASLKPLYGALTFEEMSRIIDVNLRAPIEFSRQFVQYIQGDGRRGVVLNIASTTAFHKVMDLEIYAATKAALISYTESTGHLQNVRMAAIAPCFVDSPLVAASPLFKNPEWLWEKGLVPLDKVAECAVRVVKDENAKARTFTVVGNWTVCVDMRVKEYALYVLLVVCAVSAVVARVLGVATPNRYVKIRAT